MSKTIKIFIYLFVVAIFFIVLITIDNIRYYNSKSKADLMPFYLYTYLAKQIENQTERSKFSLDCNELFPKDILDKEEIEKIGLTIFISDTLFCRLSGKEIKIEDVAAFWSDNIYKPRISENEFNVCAVKRTSRNLETQCIEYKNKVGHLSIKLVKNY